MKYTFHIVEAYRTRVLSYLGDEEPIAVQQATPSQLDRRLRDVTPEEFIRRPAPEKWSIAEIVAHLADAELRESNLRLLESVPRARWVECYGVHEVRGRQTIEEFVRLEAAHDLNHLRQTWVPVSSVAVWLPMPRAAS